MAISTLRLRRALALSSTLMRNISNSERVVSSSPSLRQCIPSNPSLFPTRFGAHSSSFHSSVPLTSSRSYNRDDDETISPDTILFEGCDYNHWLITMDFPKDPKPTPEEMVETYVQTLAKVVGSVEEAKKRMYACSTTTYTGFQAVMTEEMSEKFKGLPGVVFILPDSYIDPVNKEYGGDKYINGTIIPRPPPVQYGRGRYATRDRPRNNERYGQASYNPPQQQNYGPPGQGPSQSYGGSQQQSYTPPGPAPPQSYGGSQQQSYYPSGQGSPHSYGDPQQQSYGTPGQGTSQSYGGTQKPNYGSSGQGSQSYDSRHQQNYGVPGQGSGQNYGAQQNYGPPGQVDQRSYAPQQNYGSPGQGGGRNYVPQQNYGPPGQGDGRGFGPGGGDANYRPEQNYAGPNAAKGYDYRDGTQDQRDFFPPGGQTGTGQGQY